MYTNTIATSVHVGVNSLQIAKPLLALIECQTTSKTTLTVNKPCRRL